MKLGWIKATALPLVLYAPSAVAVGVGEEALAMAGVEKVRPTEKGGGESTFEKKALSPTGESKSSTPLTVGEVEALGPLKIVLLQFVGAPIAGGVTGLGGGILLYEQMCGDRSGKAATDCMAPMLFGGLLVGTALGGSLANAFIRSDGRTSGELTGALLGGVAGVGVWSLMDGFIPKNNTLLIGGLGVFGGGYLGFKFAERRGTSDTQVSVAPYVHNEGSGLLFSGRF